MAIHPFSLLDATYGERDTQIIGETLSQFDTVGPDYWCGYSYSWLGNMKALAFDAEGAVDALCTFAGCFFYTPCDAAIGKNNTLILSMKKGQRVVLKSRLSRELSSK